MHEKPHRDPVLLSYQVRYCAYTLVPEMLSHVVVDLSYNHQFCIPKRRLRIFLSITLLVNIFIKRLIKVFFN